MKHLLSLVITWATGISLFAQAPVNAELDFSSFHQSLQQQIDQQKLAGIACIVLNPTQTLYQSLLGVQSLETEEPITEHTLFRLASLTKVFVSLAAIQLIEQQKLKLDEPIARYLPAFRNMQVYDSKKKARPIRVFHLLTHTGGLDSELNDGPVGDLYQKQALHQGSAALSEFVSRLATFPLHKTPGTEFRYSYSTDVLARVIEVVSGQHIDQYLHEHIFQPLGMNRTGYRVNPENASQLATLYQMNTIEQLEPVKRQADYVAGVSPRGNYGLVSCISDLQRFAQMLLHQGNYDGKQIVQAESLALMTQNHLSDKQVPIKIGPMAMQGLGFGLGVGVCVGKGPLGPKNAYGWLGSTHTSFWIDPDRNIAMIFLSQFVSARPNPILFELNGQLQQAIGG